MMKIKLTHSGQEYECDLKTPIDISIPLRNGTANPNCFWAEPVSFETIRSGEFVGSVIEGGNVNYKRVILTPHGNGTHTECFGHISADPEGVITKCLNEYHFIAQLISLPIEVTENGDEVIRFNDFIKAIKNTKLPEAIIIRTLPNDNDKLTKTYSGKNPPYIEHQITQYMAKNKINHLLIDLPSVDREEDDGALLAHKAFWNLEGPIRTFSTITELIYVDNMIKDGLYLLNIQIPSMELDAVPSKPVLYPLILTS